MIKIYEHSLYTQIVKLRLTSKAKFNKPLDYLISSPSYLDIESMDTFFFVFDLENEYKLLGTKSKQIVNVLKIPKMSLSKTFRETKKINHKSKKDKSRHTMIKEFLGWVKKF